MPQPPQTFNPQQPSQAAHPPPDCESSSESASEAEDSEADDQSLSGEVEAIMNDVFGDCSSLESEDDMNL